MNAGTVTEERTPSLKQLKARLKELRAAEELDRTSELPARGRQRRTPEKLIAEILRLHEIREAVGDPTLNQRDVLQLAGEYKQMGGKKGVTSRLKELRRQREEEACPTLRRLLVAILGRAE